MNRLIALLGVALSCALNCAPGLAWEDMRLPRPLEINGIRVPYAVLSLAVSPGATIALSFADGGQPDAARINGRTVVRQGSFVASQSPGLEMLTVSHGDDSAYATIAIFTTVPASRISEDGTLNGYAMGSYPSEPLNGLDIYRAPSGFIELTEANAETSVSPNFRLGQFAAKQEGGYPKYLVLRPELLTKLERILAALNQAGHATQGLTIMSGYRTPHYNRLLGNVDFSRHLWGGAADLFIDDKPADGVMDDLNGDGRFDRADAAWLGTFIDQLAEQGTFGESIGGLGIYGGTTAHGPFVHVDARGWRARW